jgi:DNA methylase
VFIRWLTVPGDAVYDPFSGRGTVPLEAVLLGRVGLGADANPLAAALTRAKVQIPSHGSVESRLTELESQWQRASVDSNAVPDEIRMLYSPLTLGQLVFLRQHLGPQDDVDAFLIGTILGMMHANHSQQGATRGFSISMPNTFAMSPHYVARYIAENKLVRPEVDVFSMLRERLTRLNLPSENVVGGSGWQQDATTAPPGWLLAKKPRLIFTSPPYLEVIKYGKYNWVRLWFLGESWRAVDDTLMASGSLDRYIDFMKQVFVQLRAVAADDGFVCLVIGDVRRRETHLNLAQEVWEQAARPLGWHRQAILADRLPTGQKVSRIWKNNEGRATKVDRVLVLSPGPNALPSLRRLTWTTNGYTLDGRGGVGVCK